MAAEAMKAFQQFSDIFRVYAQVGGVAQPNATTMQQMQSLFLNWSDTIYQVIQHFWQPKKAYVLGQVVWTPSMPAGAIAVCTKAGTTNGTEPTWPTIMGATVNDGGVTWKIVEEAPETLPADGGTADLAKNAEKFGGQLPAYYATASELAKRAPINNPAFTGNPTAPTAAAGTSNTQIATTQFVMNAIAEISSQGKIVSYNLAQNGYCKWDIGLILQWGAAQSSAATIIQLPLPFTVGIGLLATPRSSAGWAVIAAAIGTTTIQVNSPAPIYWLAWGH